MKKIFIFVFLFLNGCSSNYLISEDFDELSEYRTYLLSLNQSFEMDNDYYIYFFEPFCSSCLSIKEDVLAKAESGNIYFINPYDDVKYQKDPYASIGKDSYNDLSVAGYPTLMEISEKRVKAVHYGTKEIRECLNF